MKISEYSFNESFSRAPVGVVERKFQPTGGDAGNSGTLSKRLTFTPTRGNT